MVVAVAKGGGRGNEVNRSNDEFSAFVRSFGYRLRTCPTKSFFFFCQ